jgi:hypothetical protein
MGGPKSNRRTLLFLLSTLLVFGCGDTTRPKCPPDPPAGAISGLISVTTGGTLVERKSGASIQLDSGYYSQDLTITIQSLALGDSDVRFGPDSTILQKPATFIIPLGFTTGVGTQRSVRYDSLGVDKWLTGTVIASGKHVLFRANLLTEYIIPSHCI